MSTTVSIRPLDVLYLRGNRLFGSAGDFAQANMPPWPSVFSGAVRARILVDRKIGFMSFLEGRVADPEIKTALGSPQNPGTFRVVDVGLSINGSVCYPAPSDLVPPENGGSSCRRITPAELQPIHGVRSSYPLPQLPVLREEKPSKKKVWWITQKGLARHLSGQNVGIEHLVDPGETLWSVDPRLGIALDTGTRSVETGKIYTSDAIALRPDVAFMVKIEGADGLIPGSGLIRLGGDGRGAEIAAVESTSLEEVRHPPIQHRRFRLVLSTPGIFPPGENDEGWLPPGVFCENGAWILRHSGLVAMLVAALVPRLEVVSGWDIAGHKPKAAMKAVPAGAVYWFEAEEEKPDVLDQLRTEGLWPLVHTRLGAVEGVWAARRAEGFNNVWIGSW